VKGTFSILPASIASATIALKKQNGDEWVNATFVYDGTKIQPGTVAKDGKLVVTLGTTELEQGKDFKIVGYGLGDGEDNVNATESDAKASVTIQGMGNYDAVDGNADPIQVKQTFQIKKRLLELSAKHDVKTFYGVSPVDKFGYTSTYVVLDENGNVVEQEEGAEDKGAEALGYTVTYKVYQDGTPETLVDEANYTSIPVSTVDYLYRPVLTLLDPKPENEEDVQADVTIEEPSLDNGRCREIKPKIEIKKTCYTEGEGENIKYYGKDGNPTTKEQYEKDCVPKTGGWASYAVLAAGAFIALSAITIAKKHNKFYQV
jgi:hypothetical protein